MGNVVLRGDLKFQDGSTYSGALKSYKKQIPHGYGIFFFPEHGKTETIDGLDIPTIKYYSGNFKNGKKEGGGKFFLMDTILIVVSGKMINFMEKVFLKNGDQMRNLKVILKMI